MTDSSGREVWATGYDENGRLVPINADIYNPIHLQGQYRDAETGLHYNRHRYYDPALGSFISKDPLGLAAGVNLYRYAPNSIGWADPLGFQAKPSPNNNLPWDFRHIFGELDLNRNPPLRGFHINRPGRQIINYWSTFPNGRYLARVIPLGGPCVHGAYQGDVQIDGDNGWQTVANNKSFFLITGMVLNCEGNYNQLIQMTHHNGSLIAEHGNLRPRHRPDSGLPDSSIETREHTDLFQNVVDG